MEKRILVGYALRLVVAGFFVALAIILESLLSPIVFWPAALPWLILTLWLALTEIRWQWSRDEPHHLGRIILGAYAVLSVGIFLLTNPSLSVPSWLALFHGPSLFGKETWSSLWSGEIHFSEMEPETVLKLLWWLGFLATMSLFMHWILIDPSNRWRGRDRLNDGDAITADAVSAQPFKRSVSFQEVWDLILKQLADYPAMITWLELRVVDGDVRPGLLWILESYYTNQAAQPPNSIGRTDPETGAYVGTEHEEQNLMLLLHHLTAPSKRKISPLQIALPHMAAEKALNKLLQGARTEEATEFVSKVVAYVRACRQRLTGNRERFWVLQVFWVCAWAVEHQRQWDPDAAGEYPLDGDVLSFIIKGERLFAAPEREKATVPPSPPPADAGAEPEATT